MRTAEELWREAGDIRSTMPDVIDVTNDSHSSFLYVLRNLYKDIILSNLDYALDKKVEQDLWNVCFKVPISGLQPKQGKKSSNPILKLFLEGAAGFYMFLLQEICAQCDASSTICKRNAQLGIFNGPSYALQPKNESVLYICQHCLIHLGDLARYRNLLTEAEGYYNQAINVEPSSGHPYNQLALLVSARGDMLSTLFYYVRSLALKHPFPPARINLDKLLKKQSVQVSNYQKTRGGRLSAEEFLLAFLKLQGQIGLGVDLDQAEQTVNLLTLTWPSLVATEALTPAQLIRMLTITLYSVGECSAASATDAQKRSLQLAIDVASSVFNACLTACCSLPDEQLPNSRYLSVIKLVLDWFHSQPEVLTKIKRGHLWSSTAKLLNQLQICFASNGSFTVDDDGKPLPEDLELLEFAPLRPSSRWPSTQLTQGDEHRIRASRIVQRGKWLAEQQFGCLALTLQSDEEKPEWLFSSLRPDESPVDKLIENLSIKPVKEIKILARPPQRNVALTAILKQKVEDDPIPSPSQDESHNKQVTFQHVLAPPLPPVKQSISSSSSSSSSYPRPSLPPRLERLKAEQKERDQLNNNFGGMYSSFGAASALPDLSIPPPTVPPPGLGFPPPPAAWAMAGNLPPPPSSIVPPYSLFNSTAPWHPGQLLTGQPSFPVTNLVNPNEQRPMQQTLGPTSLWSGPGPSPLERLLEQQKAAMRGGTSTSKK